MLVNQSSTMEPAIGIDLGTAYTRIAAFDGRNRKVIPDSHGNCSMPSYVAFTDSGVLIGEAARKQASHNPSNTIFDVIRLIGRRYSDPLVQNDMRFWPFKVTASPDDRLQIEVCWKGNLWKFTPVEICSMILIQIKENTENCLQLTITNSVVTVPALFNYEQREAVKQAGSIAGLNFVQIISTPAAVAMFHNTERLPKTPPTFADIARFIFTGEPEYNMIIFDLGAGTLDVALVTIKGDVCKVRSTAGDVHLGGFDFDNSMIDYFVNSMQKRGRVDISNSPGAICNLRTMCEKAKISFSTGTKMVPMKITHLFNDLNFDSSITEEKFNELNKELFFKCINRMDTCLRDANMGINAVNEVILAGGSARIPKIQMYMCRCLESKQVNISQSLETDAAYGAAFQSFFLSRRNERVRCLSLLDATPFSFGLVSSQGGIGVFVPKHTTIPTKVEKTFHFPNKKISVKVCEGTDRGNNLLGKVELPVTHNSSNRQYINICFEICENGTLTVSAVGTPSGMRNSITIASESIEDSRSRVLKALSYRGGEKGNNEASTNESLTKCVAPCRRNQMREKGMCSKLISQDKERPEKIMVQSSRQYVDPKEYAIGIDFGTTHSCVAVWQRNGVKIIENEYGSRVTRSGMAFTETGRLIGDSANKEQVLTNPASTISNIKRLIGKSYIDQSVQNDKKFLPFEVVCGDNNRAMVSVQYKGENKNIAPEEIASMVLSKMKEIAEAHLGSKVTKAVLSIPACFSDSQRKAIKDAGVIAGLKVMQLLNEPTAAAVAYFLQRVSVESSSEKILLIFDLGGGNLDVSIIKINEGSIKVQAVVGDTNLGGEDFDNNMVCHFVEKFMKEKKKNISNKPRSLRRLRAACEKAKRVLSTNARTVLEIDALDEGIDFHAAITREVFEELNMSLFKRSIDCVKRCLGDVKMDRSSIDEVVLVGGSTRIPKVQQLLQEFFDGKELCKSVNADEAVAYGAAVLAAILSGNENSEKFNRLEIQDVTSRSFGLESKGGAMNVLIPKNTSIPTKEELNFTNCSDDQTSMSIEVQECELAYMTVFHLSNILPKPRCDSKFNLSFLVDDNGILNLTGKDTSTSEMKDIIISKENGGLSSEEIRKMVEEAARYKADDEEHKARAAALNALENFAYKMKAIARDPRVSASDKKYMEEAADNAIAWLETNHYKEIKEIIACKRRLEKIKKSLVSFV